MKYHFKIHKDGNKFWAQGIELPSCLSQADTLEELYHNMQEALNLHIDEPPKSTDLAPLPDETIKLSKDVVEVPLEPHIAFAFLVRYNRIKQGLTQQQAARQMGFETLYSYQRLESAKCNPTLRMLAKIKKFFPDFSIDYAIAT